MSPVEKEDRVGSMMNPTTSYVDELSIVDGTQTEIAVRREDKETRWRDRTKMVRTKSLIARATIAIHFGFG